MHDILIIGAGPAGLAVASEAASKGFKVGVLEKGCVANSFCRYPANTRFVSTSAEMSIGDVFFVSSGLTPNRHETIRYYQQVARRLNVELRLRHEALEIMGMDRAFITKCTDPLGKQLQLRSKKIVVATGVYEQPRLLHIAGEELPKVSHYYFEPFPYEGSKVMIVGGGDSAAETALELVAHNVEVTLVHRKMEFERVRPWTRAHLLKAIEDRKIAFFGGSLLKEIQEQQVLVWVKERGDQVFDNDFVLLMTGYSSNVEFLRNAGVTINDSDGRPAFFQESMETNLEGLYLAGAVQAGSELGEISISDYHRHAALIVKDILSKM